MTDSDRIAALERQMRTAQRQNRDLRKQVRELQQRLTSEETLRYATYCDHMWLRGQLGLLPPTEGLRLIQGGAG